MMNSFQFTPLSGMVVLIDFDDTNNNIFRVVNQFSVEYTNNGQVEDHRLDILLFDNGLPLFIIVIHL